MIYLNNAGTTWPKPPEVSRAYQAALESGPDEWANIYQRALDEVTEFFALPHRDRFLFTSGCTAALTSAMSDLSWSEGDGIITSSLEHHALSRWLFKLADEKGVRVHIAPRASGGPMDLDFVEQTLKQGQAENNTKGRVKLIAVSHAANVTGEILPVHELAALAHENDALLLLDGAQSAGILPLDIGVLGADIFVFAGHKGPLGPMGIGGLYIGPDVRMKVPAAACELDPGADLNRRECQELPGFCDVGSFNTAAGAGLTAGLRYLVSQDPRKLRRRGMTQMHSFIQKLRALDRIKIFGSGGPSRRTHAVSMRIEGMSVAETGVKLARAGITASAGFQCSPMAHEALGTADGGTIRLSAGPFTESTDLDAAADAIAEIVRG